MVKHLPARFSLGSIAVAALGQAREPCLQRCNFNNGTAAGLADRQFVALDGSIEGGPANGGQAHRLRDRDGKGKDIVHVASPRIPDNRSSVTGECRLSMLTSKGQWSQIPQKGIDDYNPSTISAAYRLFAFLECTVVRFRSLK